jgi:hypothetical protein
MPKTQTNGRIATGRRGRPRDRVKQVLREAFRRAFPSDTVDISDGYKGNIHVLVVSRKFDRMSEREKPAFMWRVIDSTDLIEDEKQLVSLVYPLSPAELK